MLHTAPSLVAVAVSLALGVGLVRERRIGVGRAVLASLLAQELWHAVFLLAATPTDATAPGHAAAHTHATGEPGLSSMLVLHLVVSALTAALIHGADRAILTLVRAIADRLRTRPRRPLAQVVVTALPVWTLLAGPAATTHLGGVTARAPPRSRRLPLIPTPGA